MDRKGINIIRGYLKTKTELISYIMNGWWRYEMIAMRSHMHLKFSLFKIKFSFKFSLI
jgi:hypothetical protein